MRAREGLCGALLSIVVAKARLGIAQFFGAEA